ncbi:hypothetical protein HMPREF9714_03242 [Myroides odoratimimus CCUG 12901]|nr:hypothetical protein HMPREF9714_03242 [Myroides odoratimimus CCUG 12901]
MFISDIMPLKTNNSLEYKNTELLTTLKANFKGKLGLARIRLICLFIVALCKVKSVNFSKVSTGFDNCAETSSNYRRILALYIFS